MGNPNGKYTPLRGVGSGGASLTGNVSAAGGKGRGCPEFVFPTLSILNQIKSLGGGPYGMWGPGGAWGVRVPTVVAPRFEFRQVTKKIKIGGCVTFSKSRTPGSEKTVIFSGGQW